MSDEIPPAPPESIPNYLVHSILVTLFCCLPLGIVSIIFASQVNTKLAAGDIAGAQDSSDKAKKFAIWAFAVGLVGMLIYVGLMVLGIASGAASGY